MLLIDFGPAFMVLQAARIFAALNDMDYFIKSMYEYCDFGPDSWDEFFQMEKDVAEMLKPFELSLRDVYAVFKSADRHHHSPALALELLFVRMCYDNIRKGN